MVKRKKIGLSNVEDEKHDEGSSIVKEADKVAEVAIEASSIQSPSSNVTRTRTHVTRTCTKESAENVESEPTGAADKCTKVITGQRTSNRVPKRMKKETSEVSVKKIVATAKQNVPPVGSKTKRPWELWSVEDKNAFFEALCEYGKDFESIQSFIAQKSKKKGTPANIIKNKNQVRHFYYRTWHKISKFLKIGEDVRKQTQELYGLINYAELRKKIGGCLNEKNRQKLNELVFNGVTTVKYKGKKLRIKTPVCRALKKLNNVAEPKEPEGTKLPKDIIVELRPYTNAAWLHVQNLAQNPRVRTKLPLQRRLKSVIEYLQQRWKPYRLKRKEQILSSLPLSISSSFNQDPPPVLRIKPKSDAVISHLTISAMDNASSSDVCLEKYIKISREHILDKDTVKTKKSNRVKSKLTNDSSVQSCELTKNETVIDCQIVENQIIATQATPESVIKEDDKSNIDENYAVGILTPPKSVPEQDDYFENPVDEAQRSLSLLTSMLNSTERDDHSASVSLDEDEDEDETDKSVERDDKSIDRELLHRDSECRTIEEMYLNTTHKDTENLTLGQLLGLNTEKQMPSPEPDTVKNEDSTTKALTQKINSEDDVNKCDVSSFVEDSKNGWTVETAGLMTVGELYLMLGKPDKIMLEYEFESPEIHNENQDLEKPLSDTTTEVIENKSLESAKDLANMMQKLIHIASSMFVEFKNKQTPLSPTSRNIGHARVSNASNLTGKSNSRTTSKNSNVKTNLKAKPLTANERVIKETVLGTSNEIGNSGNKHISADSCSTTNSITTVVSSTSEKHLFMVPVGIAPRGVKPPNQESLREEIDKLLPGTRRGCRVRRKPLVVQRPLLPREGMGAISGPRPMTVVHLVPSGSQLTAVLPSSCAAADSKASLSSNKNVVKILQAGTGLDVRPLQVPLIKQVNPEANHSVILQTGSMPGTHLVMAPVSSQPVKQDITLSTSITDSSTVIHPAISTQSTVIASSSPSSLSSVGPLTLNILSPVTECTAGVCDKMMSSPPQISIPETSSPPSALSPKDDSPFLEISLSEDFGLTSKSQPSRVISCLHIDPVVAPKENTPPQSPPNHAFRVNSPGPEGQWLNGESVEFSLNTLLSTLESPCKILPVSSSVNIAAENSNLDPIARLAPVVDSQVRCLLDECSIDFIAKFEDLADVINSNADSKQT